MKLDAETSICSFKSLVFYIYLYSYFPSPLDPNGPRTTANYESLNQSLTIVKYDEETFLSFCFSFHRQTPISERFICKRTVPPFFGVCPALIIALELAGKYSCPY